MLQAQKLLKLENVELMGGGRAQRGDNTRTEWGGAKVSR